VDGLRVLIPDAIFTSYKRSALSLHEIEEASVSHVSRVPAGTGSQMPVVMMENCRNVFLTECFALPGTDIFLEVSGEDTANISLVGNDLSSAKTDVKLSAKVSKEQVRNK
jgi:hypothetical protein